MKNNNKSNRGSRPPIFSVLALLVIAVCVYFSIDMIMSNVRADVEIGATDALLSKLSSVNIITAIGLAALVIIFVCIQFGNYFAYLKPLQKVRADAENLLFAGRDEYSRIESLRISLSESRDTAERFLYKLDDASSDFLDISDGVTHIASAARQLFANAATVDSSAVQLMNTVEASRSGAQGSRDSTQAGRDSAQAGRNGTQAGRSGTQASRDGAWAIRDGAQAARREGAQQAAGREGAQAGREAAQAECAETLSRYFDAADNLFNMLNRQRDHINGKYTSLEQLLKNNSAQADMLSLDAAVESARAGEAGHGFAHIADGIRSHAEGLRGVFPIIHETSERLNMQAELSEELTSLFTETRMNISNISFEPPAESENAERDAEIDMERTRIRGEFDLLRAAIRSVGAALSELRDAAASEVKRAGRITDNNMDLIEDVKALIQQLNSVDAQIATITEKSVFVKQ